MGGSSEGESRPGYAASTAEVYEVIRTSSQAVLTVASLRSRLPLKDGKATTDSVADAVDSLRESGTVEVWGEDREGGPWVILSTAEAKRLKRRLVRLNSKLLDALIWRPLKKKNEGDNDSAEKSMRRHARKDVESGSLVESLPDPSSPDPARDYDEGGCRPEVYLGERLQWNGPAWADAWKRGGRCPSCEGNRDVYNVLVEHGQVVWASAMSGRYCLVCDWHVGEAREGRRAPAIRKGA